MKRKIILALVSVILLSACTKKKGGVFEDLGIEWISVPSGFFIMGGGIGGAPFEENELPAVDVYLNDYFISTTEITRRQYQHFCRVTGHPFPPTDKNQEYTPDHPVTWVSWFDAMAFCRWLSEKSGRDITLPTEAQWEKAARGGTFGDTYLYVNIFVFIDESGPVESHLDSFAKHEWFDYNSDEMVQPVARLKPNPFGLYDVLGNVREWCLDIYDKKHLKELPPWERIQTKGPKPEEVDEIIHVVKGASVDWDHNFIRCSKRGGTSPEIKSPSLGFRIVMNPEK